jgi:hypothetical protein
MFVNLADYYQCLGEMQGAVLLNSLGFCDRSEELRLRAAKSVDKAVLRGPN